MPGVVGVLEGHGLDPGLIPVGDYRLRIDRHLAGQVANIARRQIEHFVHLPGIRHTHQRGDDIHDIGVRISGLVRAHSGILTGHHPAHGVVDIDELANLDLSELVGHERHHRHAHLHVDRIGTQISHHHLLDDCVRLHVHIGIPLARCD